MLELTLQFCPACRIRLRGLQGLHDYHAPEVGADYRLAVDTPCDGCGYVWNKAEGDDGNDDPCTEN